MLVPLLIGAAVVGVVGVGYLLSRWNDSIAEVEATMGSDPVQSSATGCSGGSIFGEATRQPAGHEIDEIQAAIDAGDRRRAIELTQEYYGINNPNIESTTVRLNDPYPSTDIDGNVFLNRDAFNSPATLASSLVHEGTHANQAAVLRDNGHTSFPNEGYDYDETQAYEAERRSSHVTGIHGEDPEAGGQMDRAHDTHSGRLDPETQLDALSGTYPAPGSSAGGDSGDGGGD